MPESVAQFAARIKSKYPDYVSVPDRELVDRILTKYPEYKDQVSLENVTVSMAPSTATDEELRAARVREASPEELRRIHFGENVPSEVRAGQRRPLSEMIEGALVQAPAEAIGGISQLPGVLIRAGQGPAALGEVGVGIVKGAIEAPGKMYKTLTEGEPREVGKGLAGLAAAAAPAAKLGAAGVVGKRMASAPARALEKGTNQILSGLKPRNIRTVRALNSSRDYFVQHMQETGQKIVNTKSAAQVMGDATSKYYQTNYLPLVDQIKQVPINFKGEVVDAEWLLAHREKLNDTLGRLGYYDKSPAFVKAQARTVPGVNAALEEVEAVRKALNTAVDEVAPTNLGAAKILRTYADMKQVADTMKVRADRVELANRIKAGEAATFNEAVKDLALFLAPGVSKSGAAMVFARDVVRNLSRAPDPDKLIANGARNWLKGASAIKPEVVQRVPIPMRGPDVLPPGTQGGLPFAPPGVGAMGAELPLQPGPPRAIQVPNELTRQFNRPPDLPPGQTQLPFVPPDVGGAIPGGLTRQGLGEVFENISRGQVGPSRAPSQLALPPAGSTQLPGSLFGPREMPNPNQLFFGGRLTSPQLPKTRTRNLEEALRRVQENPPEPFRGDLRRIEGGEY